MYAGKKWFMWGQVGITQKLRYNFTALNIYRL